MRWARAGPIPGSASSSSARARSKSTGAAGPAGCGTLPGEVTWVEFSRGGRRARGRPPVLTAESTAAIWAARAARGAASTAFGARARQPRTESPSAATAATKSRARRSDGVGTPECVLRGRREAYPAHACDSYIPRSTAMATSPTTWSVTAETLSSVSSGVWW